MKYTHILLHPASNMLQIALFRVVTLRFPLIYFRPLWERLLPWALYPLGPARCTATYRLYLRYIKNEVVRLNQNNTSQS
jgi:hypothetical protein